MPGLFFSVASLDHAGNSCSWLRFDDGNVFQVKQQDVLTNRPYLLFYQRVL